MCWKAKQKIFVSLVVATRFYCISIRIPLLAVFQRKITIWRSLLQFSQGLEEEICEKMALVASTAKALLPGEFVRWF
jgi:hypothetical protein